MQKKNKGQCRIRNRIRIEKLEDIQGKKSIQERDRFCFCQLYPNYQGCNCKEYEDKAIAEDRELEWNDIYNMVAMKKKDIITKSNTKKKE